MERVFLDAAHGLRTPLTRIRGEIDLILRSDVSDPPRSQLEKIQEDLERFELDEAPGGGSMFRLVLPACPVS